MNTWMDKDVYVYILPSHNIKHNKMLPFATDGLGEYYAKWNKSNRERQTLCDITYVCLVSQSCLTLCNPLGL